jgi:Xaa-Pro aminopeptidase
MKRIAAAILFLATMSAGAIEREPVTTYQERRQALAAELGGTIVILAAAPDDLVQYEQDDNFYYLTGFTEPDAALMIDGTTTPATEYLFLPPRDFEEERWTGVKLGPGPEAERETGVGNVVSLEDFESEFTRLAGTPTTVHTILGREDALSRLQSIVPGAEYADAADAIARMRLVKTDDELALLEKAIRITMDAHRAAAARIGPDTMEYEVEAEIEYEFRRNGAERPAFPSIVGSGPFSTILHYDRNDRRMQEGDLVVVDIGAEYSGYAADITRTYPVNGRFTGRQREIYEIVLNAQKAALAQVRPGARLNGPDSIHSAARDYIEAAGYGDYFIHGTSHYIGLYVHDVGNTRTDLEPNMVLTVEPGIYIPEENIGVRIEDDVVVTESGYRMLSDFPREADEIEALMADASNDN